MRSILLCAAVALVSVFASAENSSSDSEALQSLVKEIHQLRQDLVTSTVAAQRVQIVLYRLQGQQAAVQRAAERHNLTRDRLSDTESQIKTRTAELQRYEDLLQRSQSDTERKDVQEQVLPQLKGAIETLRHQQEQQQIDEAQSEEQLRNEQSKLSDLENFLDKLDKSLSDLERPASSQ